MNSLCFGTFARIVQSAIQKPDSNQAVAELLMGLITDKALDGQLSPDYSTSAKKISRLFNFKDDVHGDIIALASTEKIIESMPESFVSKVVPYLKPTQIEDMKESLRRLIDGDMSIAPNKKKDLLSLVDKDDLSCFLSEVYLYALNRSNKAAVGKYDMEVATEIAPDDIALLNKIYSKYPRPKEMVVPNEPTDEELAYITQLLEAYAEAAGVTELSRSALSGYPKYNNDLRQRRKEYYAAETIRRGTREVFKESDADQFELLKEETYDGIFDIHSQDYKSGYDRLLKVMTQVSSIQINKCSLSKLPEWIGNKEKKGVCHILANDGRISWVVRDE
ncbi:ABC-three component system protein [Marasmitruncus massiliensis]|uniref:ABC-three component system protein n=1 Tax=Marasmitruncus massiliensis TaxID=1944642 RepID=UPI000C7AB944|nr:ABC-three component system protein [Marasmitruncus massiliensis]